MNEDLKKQTSPKFWSNSDANPLEETSFQKDADVLLIILN